MQWVGNAKKVPEKDKAGGEKGKRGGKKKEEKKEEKKKGRKEESQGASGVGRIC